jgi:CBS domain containing-hemolysin-like protein
MMYIMYPVAYPASYILGFFLGESRGTVYKKAGLYTYLQTLYIAYHLTL